LDAKSKATTAREVVQAQEHLNQEQQDQLEEANTNTDELFDGKLGHNKAEETCNWNRAQHLSIHDHILFPGRKNAPSNVSSSI